jgi:TPP-dependent pyruvate/acetoin dehydrogenase alpha subunit
MSLTRKKQLLLYRNMQRGRRFDEAMIELFAKGHIPGMWHSGIGQEATEAGAATFLREDDWLVCMHRGVTASLAKGLDPKKWLAEHLGRATGYAKGKGGHNCADREHGVTPFGLIMGGWLPIAAGAAIAAKRAGKNQVVVCLFGDGSAQRGTLHECMNLAAVWKLPLVWVCENNFFSITTHVKNAMAAAKISDLAYAYQMPGSTVDGQDAIAVAQAVLDGVARARKGDGPSLVECQTYRFREHGEGDIPTPYRTREEVLAWKKRDPVQMFREQLRLSGARDAKRLEGIDREISVEVDEAVRWAMESPWPQVGEALTDLYHP